MDDREQQLLEYLAGQPNGHGLVCSPELTAALKDICHREPRWVSDVYEGPGGMTARITPAGRYQIMRD